MGVGEEVKVGVRVGVGVRVMDNTVPAGVGVEGSGVVVTTVGIIVSEGVKI